MNHLAIDLSALIHNLNQVKAIVGEKTKVMAVVKTDAYGHGLVAAAKALENSRAHCLGVAHFHEAMELRNRGISLPIVILCGIRTREEAEAVVSHGLIPTLFDPAVAEVLAAESARKKTRVSAYVKVDTGMGRLGLVGSELASFLNQVRRFKEIRMEGLTSHLSSADEADPGFTENQIRGFARAIEIGRAMGLDLPLNNLANSAGLMKFKSAHFDMVRPGIMLYGGLPSPDFNAPVALKPVMRFAAEVIQVRDFPDNTPVSYSRTYCTQGPRRIAVLSAGYGEGLFRSLSNRGKVLIRGKKVPITGRVCMNMTMVDVTGLKDVSSGEEAVFLGTQDGEKITADDLSSWAGTISYDILCSVGQRNPKEYV
ncbi:MAG: alanine racemase [Desulfobacterota bacterium]|jgi:alanine racemase|nr:alanine racemase [Thermodesulfobacteriota bacterium]